MTASWEQADVFPAIARIIECQFLSKGDFVTHDEITSSLAADSEGAGLISRALEESDEAHTAEWIAHNMVAWFSQRISVGESDWKERFDRAKVDGKWAYRPKDAAS
jgi:hypothetical protein